MTLQILSVRLFDMKIQFDPLFEYKAALFAEERGPLVFVDVNHVPLFLVPGEESIATYPTDVGHTTFVFAYVLVPLSFSNELTLAEPTRVGWRMLLRHVGLQTFFGLKLPAANVTNKAEGVQIEMFRQFAVVVKSSAACGTDQQVFFKFYCK